MRNLFLGDETVMFLDCDGGDYTTSCMFHNT